MNVIERMQAIEADKKIADFRAKQQLPYEQKIAYAEIRAWEFYRECGKRDLNCHVSVGGLDSITLYLFLRSIGIKNPAVSVSTLEVETPYHKWFPRMCKYGFAENEDYLVTDIFVPNSTGG